MANRFPLVLNTSSNQLQELASGDTLDLTGSGLNLTGITTLSSSAQLNLNGGTNINTGTRGDILFYNSSNQIQKLSLGASGKILKSNGSDLVYGDSGTVANVYYVSSAGTDASGFGGSVDRAFASIKYACSNIGTPTASAPAIIFVKAGVYEEGQLPIVVPAHTTIAGDSLRATIVKPGSGLDSSGSVLNTRSILFRCSNAVILQDMVLDGMGGYTPGSPAYKPESATVGGTYFALNAASPVINKSPYIYNITSFGNGATGAVLDGSLHSSGNRSMLFHTYTAVHSDGLGIWLQNNANAEMISTFTYYCVIGLAATGGSKIRSLNSSNAYGEYGVYSAGFDAGETANTGTIKGQMLVYTNVLTTSFTDGEQVTGGTSGATGYVVNVQAEPKRIYIVQRSGTFQSSETVTGGSSGATATLTSGTATVNQSGRILVTTFSTTPDAGDSLQFASTDGNAFQIQSVSSVTANSVAYKVLVFSTSRATAVAENVTVKARKEFSLARLTGHDFLQVGTGGTDTTNWPNNPTQTPAQADQIVTNETDPGRVYYTATDESGNFYVGDQFKVDQATGNVTLDASAFNLSGLESLRLGSVGGLIGAAVGEFSTDVTLSQNSDTKVSTQKAVKTYVDTLDDVTPVGGTFTVAGISTVTGTTQFTKQLNVSGVSTFHGNVNLLDGDRLRVGSSEDLQVYHDGNHSYIAENGGGDLKIQASTGSIFIQKSTGEEMIKATVDGAVELYHDDVLRLSTSSTGVSIPQDLDVDGHTNLDNVSVAGVSTFGDITATSFGAINATSGSFSGNVSIGGTLTYEDVSNIDSVGIVTARSGLVSPNADIDDFISVGSNIHLGNAGVCTATTFSGSGASLTNLNGSNIASGTVPVARIGTGTKDTTTFYRGDGTFQVVNTDLVSDTSPQLGGSLDTNNKNVNFGDSSGVGVNRLRLGASNDLQIFHSSNVNYITGEVDGVDLYLRGRRDLYLQCGNNASSYRNVIYADNNGTTRLYHPASNAERLRTTTNGVETTGSVRIGDGSHGFALSTNGVAAESSIARTTSNPEGIFWHNAVNEYGIYKTTGSWSDPYQQLKLDWTTGIELDGGSSYGKSGVRFASHAMPTTNNNFDLGSTALRWRNVYTNDLNLSNEGNVNEVDGTWGNYTIQEGESDLFLINRRNGKRYKFNLTEID